MGQGMERLAQVGVNDLDKHRSDGGGCGCCGSRFTLIYVWNTRIRPLQPSLDLEWAADCEHLTTATVEGSTITFRKR